MIGNNSCGARSVIYGKTIDHVLGLKAVLADAQMVEMGPVDGETYAEKVGQENLEGKIYKTVREVALGNAEGDLQPISGRYASSIRL